MILQISTRSWCGYIEMNFFVLLLAFRLVSSDKLDRTYLPPPGSKYAGGNDGDLDLPLEIPRESYTTTGRPFQGQKGLIPIDSTEPTIGINRGLGIPTIPSDYTSFTQASRRPFNSIQNKLNVPTTTISYAFTQTTTLPPQEGFESTLNPTQLSDIEGQNFFGSDEGIYPKNIPGQKYLPKQTYNQQGFINQPVGQRPGYRPLVKGQQNIFGSPGLQTQFVPPGYLPTNQQAGISTEGNLQQLDQNRPESQIPGKQGSRPGYQNISGSQSTQSSQSGYRPGLQTSQGPNYDLETFAPTKPSFIGQNEYSQPELKNVTFNQQSYEVNTPSGASTISPITGTTIRPGYRPESPNQDQEQNQYFGSQLPMNQQGFIQFTMSPQGFYQQTSNMQGFPLNQQIFDGRQPSIPSTVSLPQNRPEINSYFGNVPTQRPSQIPGSQPFSPNLSTQASPTIGSPLYPTNIATQEYPTTQSSFPQYGIDGDKGRLPGSQQKFGYKRPTQATSFQGTTSGTSSGPGLGQSYNEETLIDLTSPTTGSRQFGQNQYENANEKFSGQFETTPRPGITGNQQNMYSPQAKPSSISTTYPGQTSLGLTPGYGTTPKPVYGTTPTSVYPSSSPGTYQEASAQANVGRPGIIPKPERPQAESDRNAVILNYENILTPEGYAYSFDTSNGIHADESGTATDGVRAQGSYSYIGDDGKEYSVIYSADENGFLPRGDHLPTPPPIPEAIQRVIEQAERDKEAGIYHDGSYDEAKYGHEKYMRPRSRPRPNQKGGTIVNGVDIPESSDDNNDNSQPSLLSPDKRPNFGQGQTEQDNDDHEFDNGTKKSQMINRKPINRKTYQKPIKESILEDKYDQEDVTDEYGNVIKPILYKPSKQGTLSKRPLAPGRNTTDFLVNKPHDTQNESEDYYDRRVEQDDTKVTFRPGQQPDKNPTLPKGQKSKPGASTSSYSEITSNYMNEKDFYNENQTLPETQSSVVIQKQFIRPGSSTSAYSELSETQRPVEFAYDEIHRPGLQTYIGKPKGSKAPASSVYSEVNKQTLDGLSNVRNSQSPKRPSIGTDAYSEVGLQTPKEFLPQEEYVDEIQIEGISKSPGSQKPIETVSGDKIDRIQKPEKPQTGYQYIPPKNKFIQDERNRFPTRFPDIQVTTDKPEIEEKTGKPSTAKPFITPNVSRDKDDSYDDYDSNMSFKQKITYETTKSPMTTDEYDHYLKTETDYENNPSVVDENYYNENAPSITERPINPGFVDVTSTQRPTYPNQSTKGKPLFKEKTRAGIEKNPGQVNRNEKIPDVKYEKIFGQRIGGSIKPESNNTLNTRRPVKPTQKPNQYTTQSDPFYENTEAQTIDTTRQPGSYEEEIVTIDQRPATRRPSQKPLFRPGETPVTSTVRPEITIYQPDKSTTGYSDDEFTELEPDMIRSGVSKTPFSITTESTGDLSTTVPDYDRTSFSSTIIRPRIPGRPGTRTQIPSTTYRPNYSVISGQQPTQVSVDGFGRPITTDANQEFGTSTTRPQYDIPSSMTRLSYNDKTKINQQNRYNQTFSPNEPRFGQIDDKNKYINLGDETFESGEQQMVLRPQNQRLYGTQNQNFDAQSPNTSFGMNQSTTEKVIGEDFSGPKRPQGFDPKYGYYY